MSHTRVAIEMKLKKIQRIHRKRQRRVTLAFPRKNIFERGRRMSVREREREKSPAEARKCLHLTFVNSWNTSVGDNHMARTTIQVEYVTSKHPMFTRVVISIPENKKRQLNEIKALTAYSSRFDLRQRDSGAAPADSSFVGSGRG